MSDDMIALPEIRQLFKACCVEYNLQDVAKKMRDLLLAYHFRFLAFNLYCGTVIGPGHMWSLNVYDILNPRRKQYFLSALYTPYLFRLSLELTVSFLILFNHLIYPSIYLNIMYVGLGISIYVCKNELMFNN